MKRPRKIQLPATKASSHGTGHQDSDEEDGPWRLEEADHGRGYEGDTSSGSSCSLGEHSHRPRAGHRSPASSHGCRSPGDSSQTNGLALVSGFKRLPRQDVQMRPMKSVLVRRRENEGELANGRVNDSGTWGPHKGTAVDALSFSRIWCVVRGIMAPKTSSS